jgi:hypothetical protein
MFSRNNYLYETKENNYLNSLNFKTFSKEPYELTGVTPGYIKLSFRTGSMDPHQLIGAHVFFVIL